MVDQLRALPSNMNVIGDLIRLKAECLNADDKEFAAKWLARLLAVELERINFEDDAIDRESPEYLAAVAALDELTTSDDWVHPLLSTFATAYRKTGELKEIETVDTRYRVPPNGHVGVTLVGRSPAAPGAKLSVSSRYADFVPILESQAGNPLLAKQLEVAFIERIAEQVAKAKIDHLCFVEKEVGPVGALCMMSALVSATRLPACIYREPLWPDRAAISGVRPRQTSKVAIIYDLAVTGAGLVHVAEQILSLTGAQTQAAIVSYQYEGCPSVLRYNDNGLSMFLESLGTESGRDASADSAKTARVDESKVSHKRHSSTTGTAASVSGRGSLAAVSATKETDMSSETLTAIDRSAVSEALARLLGNSPVLVNEFLSAFAWRAEFRELPESRGQTEGLYRVLSYLVRSIPTEKQIEAVDYYKRIGRDTGGLKIEGILDLFNRAIRQLALQDPKALVRLNENVVSREVSLDSFLGGLLVDYIQSREILPD